ncbi:zinc metallochaperone AztD [Arthrobacter sp. CJ23]|uniref:zinc metallochaperone AztD n=1 Tax=Arthrobacter sp. CJ23 TaxID=2972479 RepID=UPI00215BCC52|nr:zinc metallochaperone AztD [Arthrobacter sp. CJ23]UVJ39548.1 zinc metallochaperone AztD [Arthrobacter sp. CJ23]
MITHPIPSSVRTYRALALPAVVAVSALLLTGCGGAAPAAAPGSARGASSEPAPPEGAKEAQARTPRLVLTHDAGITVLDAKTLKPVGGAELEGFNRLNPAGDGRHLLVSTGDAFRVFDAGVWTEAHGDHGHHYAGEPRLLDRAFAASKAGHVVRHAGRTVLFNDGTGKVESFDPAGLADAVKTGLPATEVYTTPDAHHGVAVGLPGGKLLVTLGNDKGRSGIAVLDAAPEGGSSQDRKEIVRNEDCPGVHGEAVAAHEAVVVGCENGMLIYKDGKITKVASPDAYGRMGNQAGSEKSPVILGDYKVDKAATLERPKRISLVNTETGTLQLVDLGASYSFRSLGRGPAGEALVLGTDGALRVIDPLSGAVTSTIPVVAAWEESETWQDPRPTLFVQGTTAFVTEPAQRTIHAVDLKTGKVTKSAQLDVVPNELSGVEG